MNQTVFMTLIGSDAQVPNGRALIDSIRTFGGSLCDSPIWVFVPEHAACPDMGVSGVQVIPLSVPATVRDYAFGDMVSACAQAEAMAAPELHNLVYIDPLCLIVNPPVAFDLGDGFDAAVRPVHIRNIGLLATDPLDPFWQTVYRTAGANDAQATVESFVDGLPLRAYYNAHSFAINPAMHVLHRWFDCFEQLVGNRAFQAQACADRLHRTFLFQAILSALLDATIAAPRIRILPPQYSYPYHLHQRTAPERRAQSLSDLVCVAYEERDLHPQRVADIRIDEPLKSWLGARWDR